MVRPAGETAQCVRSPASRRSAGERGRGGARGRGQSHDCGSRGTAADRGERQQQQQQHEQQQRQRDNIPPRSCITCLKRAVPPLIATEQDINMSSELCLIQLVV